MDEEMSDLEAECIVDSLSHDVTVAEDLDPLKEHVKIETVYNNEDVEIDGPAPSGKTTALPKTLPHKCGLCGLFFEDADSLSQHISTHEQTSDLLRNLLSNPQDTSIRPEAINTLFENTSTAIQPAANKSNNLPLKNTPKTRVAIKEKPILTLERWQNNLCQFCDLEFANRGDLLRHRDKHLHPDNPENKRDESGEYVHELQLDCDFCEAKFLTWKNMVVHARSHVRTIGNECEECKVYFPSKIIWDTHVRLHEIYQCHLCPKRFTLNAELFAHLNTHDSFFAFTCRKCKARFKEKAKYLEHKKMHKAPRTKIYPTISELDPWHVCDFCNGRFNRPDVYESHMPTHAPFFCHVCNVRYNNYEELQEHMRVEEHGYECEACSEKFERKYLLLLHLGPFNNPTRCKAQIVGPDLPSSAQ